jgi:hypothetical protein
LAIYNEKPVEVKQIVTEHKVDDSMVLTPPIESWYKYIPPVFKKKKKDDDEIITY